MQMLYYYYQQLINTRPFRENSINDMYSDQNEFDIFKVTQVTIQSYIRNDLYCSTSVREKNCARTTRPCLK